MKLLRCLFFLTIIVAAQSLTDEQKEKNDALSKECRLQTGVSQEVILKARGGDFEEDPKLKQHILCVAKKVGIVDESGDIIVDTLKNKVKRVSQNDEEADAIISKCVVKKNTRENSLFESIKCVIKAKPQFSPVD